MQKSVLVPIGDGCEEIETVSIVDTLRRADLHVVLASIHKQSSGTPIIKGSNKISIVCDNYLESVVNQNFDIIALPGGLKNAQELANCKPLIKKLEDQKKAGKWFAAICASPALVLEPHGLLQGLEGTCFPSMQDKLSHKTKAHQRVVVSHNCITSQGPGTAIEFALMIIEKLCSPEKAMNIAKSMVAYVPK